MIQPGAAKAAAQALNSPTGSEPISGLKSSQRVYSATREIVVDLYKLLTSQVTKRIGVSWDPDESPQDFVPFDHQHLFRTFDSDGKAHTFCTPLGGHTHEVILGEAGPNGEAPPIISVGPPVKFINKKVKGKMTKVAVAINHYDFHTHEAEYLQSHKTATRQSNVAAQMLVAQENMKYASVPGASPETTPRKD